MGRNTGLTRVVKALNPYNLDKIPQEFTVTRESQLASVDEDECISGKVIPCHWFTVNDRISELSITVMGLMPVTAFHFVVRCHNGVGWSNFCDRAKADRIVTEAGPPCPSFGALLMAVIESLKVPCL